VTNAETAGSIKDTITVSLEGDSVTLATFAAAVQATLSTVDALSREIAPETRVQWLVDDLSRSSAQVTIRGRTVVGEEESTELIVSAFGEVAQNLERHQRVPRSKKVAAAAGRFLDLIGPDLRAVRLETPDVDAVIEQRDQPMLGIVPRSGTLGAVRGRIQTLSNRGSIRFTLFDTLADKGISCYLEPDDQEQMRGLWGRLAVVEGVVSRNRQGQPRSIRHITSITPLPDSDEVKPLRWRDAIGAAPPPEGAESAEAVIRRLRDG
jgi:hypothetical protein